MAEDPDPLRAWAYLRCDPAYRAAWRESAAPSEYERDTPFPVRIRSDVDRAAVADWSLLAWQDLCDEAGPPSPFFADIPMLDGTGSAAALLPLLAEAGAALEGLWLRNGVLILRGAGGQRLNPVRETC